MWSQEIRDLVLKLHSIICPLWPWPRQVLDSSEPQSLVYGKRPARQLTHLDMTQTVVCRKQLLLGNQQPLPVGHARAWAGSATYFPGRSGLDLTAPPSVPAITVTASLRGLSSWKGRLNQLTMEESGGTRVWLSCEDPAWGAWVP